MALQRKVISWPLTGGIDSKTAPLQVQPGSHITLDNVRQERVGEWRRRNGFTDVSGNNMPTVLPPVIVGPLGVNGLIAMQRRVATGFNPIQSSVCVYTGASNSGWKIRDSGGGTCQQAPVSWSRRTLIEHSADPDMIAAAVGANTTMLMYISGGQSFFKVFKTDTGVDALGEQNQGSALRGAGAYVAPFVCLFAATSGGNILVTSYNDTTLGTGSTSLNIGTNGHTTQPYMDAIAYPGSSTITLVYRTSGNQIQFVEYNPSTQTKTTDVTLALACDNCLSLLPDPDGSGIRFVALSNAVPEVRVVRVNSAGAVQTNDAADTKAALQIGGCGYQAGAGWMIVYTTATNTFAVKKRSAVVSAAFTLNTTSTSVVLNSNAWRESSDDLMRFVLGIHSTVATDPQDTYVEMCLPFEDGSATISDFGVRDAQARLLPLEAGAGLAINASLPQVQRRSADTFYLVLRRLAKVSRTAGALGKQYTTDQFVASNLNTSNMSSVNQGRPVAIGGATYLPVGNLLEALPNGQVSMHGLIAVPKAPVLTPATGAGSLTLLATYQYCTVIRAIDGIGREWRSPPSTPTTVTLTGTQNQVGYVEGWFKIDNFGRVIEVELYRTKANGSILQKVASSFTTPLSADISGTDQAADTVMGSGDFLYTHVEAPTALTPPAAHVAVFGDRMWLANRDFRTELWFSKRLRPNRSPEFVDAFVLDFDDEFGDITGLAALDDKLVVFKRNAVYVVQGDGPDDAGAGSYPNIMRVDGDVGAISGSPLVSTGSEVFFVSERGIYRMDRSIQIDFVGSGVDRYLNQPLVQTREVVKAGVFVPSDNEVRFVTTNYVLSYDRLYGIWYRDTGGLAGGLASVLLGAQQAIFYSNGHMLVEGDQTVTLDGAAGFTGSIRSAWIRPAGTDGRMRLYMARLIMTRTSGGGNVSPTLKIYYDNDDTIVEQFSPTAVIPGSQLVTRASVQPARHRCSAFSLEAILPTNDVTLRLDAWGAEIGVRSGAFRNSPAERWD